MWERGGARSVRDLIEIMSVITLYIYILRVGGTSFSPVSGLRNASSVAGEIETEGGSYASPFYYLHKTSRGTFRTFASAKLARNTGTFYTRFPRKVRIARTCTRDDQTRYRTYAQGDLSGTCMFSYRVRRWLWKFLKRT